MLPHVVRFNSQNGQRPYSDVVEDPDRLAARVEQLLDAGQLPRTLRRANVPESKLPELAKMAATQWTATFNPRKVEEAEMLEIYRMAL
jgi:alcohol dehydrogenase